MPVFLPSPSTATRRFLLLAGACLVARPDALAAGDALPQGGSVAAGSVHIGTPAGNALAITQTSPAAVVNWQAFSIGSGNTVNFSQRPTDQLLNRVTGQTSSSLAGTLNAGGSVYLVNPNGITITPSGKVMAGGGFVASTLDISTGDFMRGRRTFAGNGASAGVSNEGSITVGGGGYAALLGGTVSNSGVISVPLGKVGLGSGERITLDPSGDGFMQVAVPTAASGRPLIDVAGKISAKGGLIELKAATVKEAIRDAVNVSGALEARSVSGRDGAIILEGGPGGRVAVTGRLDVSGRKRAGTIAVSGQQVNISGGADTKLAAKSRDGTGGVIMVTADSAVSVDNATLDASGGTGGGTILIGGGWRGGGTLAHAVSTYIGENAVLRADATANGSGGQVVVWSDAATVFRGLITARGAADGAGGMAEVSSHGVLGFEGRADLTAASGVAGTLLLDPYNVTIQTAGPDANITCVAGVCSPTGNDSILTVATLVAALGSTNVIVDTGAGGAQSGDISVTNAITWGGTYGLTLSAANDIAVNADITTGGGYLTLTAAGDGSGSITVTGATIDTGGGNLTMTASQPAGGAAITLDNVALNVGAGTGVIDGSSSSPFRFGVVFSGANTLTAAGGGSLSITGHSTEFVGTIFNPGAAVTTSGTIEVRGTSDNGYGLILDGSVTVAALTGALTMTGEAAGVSGVEIYGADTLTNAGAAGFSLTGQGTSNARGLVLFEDSSLATSGNMTLAGISDDWQGFDCHADNTITHDGGTLTIMGISTWDSGISIGSFDGSSSLINSSGTMSLTGTSTNWTGIYIGADTPLTVSGSMTLTGVSNSDYGFFLETGVALTQADGNVTLSGTSTTSLGIATAAGSIITNNGAGTLTLSATGGMDLDSAITSVGGVTLTTTDDLTLQAGAQVTGASPVLAATGAFINIRGADAVAATSGRWLIYSSDPGADTFGALNSNNTAIWNATYTTRPPASVTPTGNRYLFATPATLTFTSTDAAKTYGTDLTAALATHFTVSGYQPGVPGVYLADTAATAFSGAPSITSPGANPYAAVGGSPYAITAALGSLSSASGYGFAYNNAGLLTVTPKTINYVVANTVSLYGSRPRTAVTFPGVLPGDDVNAVLAVYLNGALVTLSRSSLPGTYLVTVTGISGADAGNYVLATSGNNNGTLTITTIPGAAWASYAAERVEASMANWCALDIAREGADELDLSGGSWPVLWAKRHFACTRAAVLPQ